MSGDALICGHGASDPLACPVCRLALRFSDDVREESGLPRLYTDDPIRMTDEQLSLLHDVREGMQALGALEIIDLKPLSLDGTGWSWQGASPWEVGSTEALVRGALMMLGMLSHQNPNKTVARIFTGLLQCITPPLGNVSMGMPHPGDDSTSPPQPEGFIPWQPVATRHGGPSVTEYAVQICGACQAEWEISPPTRWIDHMLPPERVKTWANVCPTCQAEISDDDATIVRRLFRVPLLTEDAACRDALADAIAYLDWILRVPWTRE